MLNPIIDIELEDYNKLGRLLDVVYPDDIDITYPDYDLDYEVDTYTDDEKIFNINYCYIDEFDRYYFIDNIDFLSNKLFRLYMSVDVWHPLLCLAVLCSSLAFSLWVSTIKTLGVAKSSIFSALIPVAAALIAWAIGHESLNERQWIGIAISAFGVILSQYTIKSRKK